MYYSLLLVLTALIPAYLVRFEVFSIPTNLFELLVVIVTLLYASHPPIRRHWLAAWRSLPFFIKLFSFTLLLSAAISVIIAFPDARALGLFKSLFIIPILFAFQVYSAIRHRPSLINRFPAALLFSGAFIALLGLSQLGHLDRIKSLYDVPSSLALYLVPLIIIALWPPARLLYRLLGLVMLIALVFTQSLGGVMALAVALTAGIFFLPLRRDGGVRKSANVVILLLIASTAILSVSGRLAYFLQPLSDPAAHTSLSVRQQLWSVSFDLIQDRPFLGLGLGQFEPAYQQKLHERFIKFSSPYEGEVPSVSEAEGSENALRDLYPLPPSQTTEDSPFARGRKKPPIREFVFRDPHNWILSFWLNLGALGLISFIGLNVVVLRQSLLQSPVASAASFTGIALLAILLHGLVDTTYWKNDLAALYWMLVALVMAAAPAAQASAPASRQRTADL